MTSLNNNLTVSSTPFGYYSIEFSSLDKKNAIQKTVTFSKEIFRNAFYCLYNSVVVCANTLRLYKLIKANKPKMEIAPTAIPTKWQTAAFVIQVLGIIYFPLQHITTIFNSRTITNLFLVKDSIDNDLTSTRKFSLLHEIILDSSKILDFSKRSSLTKGFSLINQSINTYTIAKRTCANLYECWTLSHKDPLTAVKYALIHSSNLLFSLSHLYSNALWHLNKARESLYHDELDNIIREAHEKYGDGYENSPEFWKKRDHNQNNLKEFIDYAFKRNARCGDYLKNLKLLGKSDEEKIDALDPTCPNDAKNIISNRIIFDMCSKKNLKLLKTDYRKKSTQFHTDKHPGKEAYFYSLQNAYATIDKYCTFSQRHKKYSLKNLFFSN